MFEGRNSYLDIVIMHVYWSLDLTAEVVVVAIMWPSVHFAYVRRSSV